MMKSGVKRLQMPGDLSDSITSLRQGNSFSNSLRS